MWKLSFISEKDVQLTIDKYREKLQSFDLKRFNKNIVDPIKLILINLFIEVRGNKL